MAARDRHRRGPPGRARLTGAGGAGGRGRRAPGRGAPGRDDGRLDGGGGHGRAHRWRGGAGGVRARGRATGAADAGVQRDRRSRRRWRRPAAEPVAIDTKLDGIRIQVHRRGDDVIVATRSLEDITGRLPEVVAVARALPSSDFVLDGEVLALDDQGRPRPFQETASRTAMSAGVHLTPYFFDLLHLDGRDLVDSPGSERLAALTALVPEEHLVPRLVTSDVAEAEAFVSRVLDLRPRGRRRQEPRRAVRRRPPRLGLGEGEAGPHPRPGRPRRRVGLRPPPGLALQRPPRGSRRGRFRDARQDFQGDDGRDAHVADGTLPVSRDGS